MNRELRDRHEEFEIRSREWSFGLWTVAVLVALALPPKTYASEAYEVETYASETDAIDANSLTEESRRLSQRNYDFQSFLQMRSKRPTRERESIEQIKLERQRLEAEREAARLAHLRTRVVYSMTRAERLEARDQQRVENRERRQEARRRRYVHKRELIRDLADRLDRVDAYRELDLKPDVAPERKVLGTK